MKTHCKRGHELIESNIYWYNGVRHCKKCRNIRAGETRRRNQEKLDKLAEGTNRRGPKTGIKTEPKSEVKEETKPNTVLAEKGLVIIMWFKN